MKYFIIGFFLISCLAFSQEKATTHLVTKDDTILQISNKYNITPYDLYQLNPDIKNGLQPNMVLVVSKNGIKNTPIKPAIINNPGQKHEVKTKETFLVFRNYTTLKLLILKKQIQK